MIKWNVIGRLSVFALSFFVAEASFGHPQTGIESNSLPNPWVAGSASFSLPTNQVMANDSQAGPPSDGENASVMVEIGKGKSRQKIIGLAANDITRQVEALLQSCGTRSKRLVSEEDWEDLLRSGRYVYVRYLEPARFELPTRSGLVVTAILVPGVGSQWKDAVLTRHAEITHSPFIMPDPELLRQVRRLIEQPAGR